MDASMNKAAPGVESAEGEKTLTGAHQGGPMEKNGSLGTFKGIGSAALGIAGAGATGYALFNGRSDFIFAFIIMII
jgi:hypothetical protein